MANCGIRDSYGRCIGDLCRHKRLMELNLSGNEFEETGCILIGNILSKNKKKEFRFFLIIFLSSGK